MSRKGVERFHSHLAYDDFRRMMPEDRVKMAVEMSSVVTAIIIESILVRDPKISRAELFQEARRRFPSGRMNPLRFRKFLARRVGFSTFVIRTIPGFNSSSFL